MCLIISQPYHMHQRKKNQNKQNYRAIKRTTLQQINYTQQLHIPTYVTMDLRPPGRSIELKKTSSKKSGSRKSRCISAKQVVPRTLLGIKQLMKQFKSMKLTQSRSRSPHSSKSKHKSRKSSKKIIQPQAFSKANSQLNLTSKVKKTLQKLNVQSYLKDEQDSHLSFLSTSSAFTQEQKKRLQYIFSGENFEDINICQLRLFCKNNEPGIRINLGCFKGNIYEIMAKRIQRAWRKYQTHKLVERYTNLIIYTDKENSAYFSKNHSPISRHSREDVVISSQQLYLEQQLQRKVTYISNLQQQQDEQIQKEMHQVSQNEQLEQQQYHTQSEALLSIKREQLEKWSQIVTMINSNKTQSAQETEKLYKQIMNKSELNKRILQPFSEDQDIKDVSDIYENHNSSRHKKQEVSFKKSNDLHINQYETHEWRTKKEREDTEQEDKKPKSRQQHDFFQEDSGKSAYHEFNSKKYIEYLDGDMYPMSLHQKQSPKIDKSKQSTLLMKLQSQNSMKRLTKRNKISAAEDIFEMEGQIKSRLSCRSSSQPSQNSSILAQELKSSSRASARKESKLLNLQVRKSSSLKNIKITSQSNLFINTDAERQKQQPIQQLDINILQNSDKPTHSIEKQNNPKQQIKSLLFETVYQDVEQNLEIQTNMQQYQADEYEEQIQTQTHNLPQQQDVGKLHIEDEARKKFIQLQKLREQYKKHLLARPETKIKHVSQESSRIPDQDERVENEDYIIDSSEDDSEADVAEKGEQIAETLTNKLILQVLIDMAKYPDSMLKKFKHIALKKPKIKRTQPKPKKNGFPTNQAQIKGLIQELCKYVINQEPQIFKNLQRATGPTALQMLKYMHQSIDEDIYLDESEDDPSVMILPNWIFERFWDRKLLTIKYEKQGLQEQEMHRQQYIKGLNKIFLRACFDCFNECLDYERNYGPLGKPFPWKKSHLFDHIKTLQETRKSVLNAQKRLFQISATYCGIIIQKQQIISLCGNEDYVTQVQEDRLSRMLAQDLVQGEQRWIFYDDEETQLLVEVSNIIFDQLMQEMLFRLTGRQLNLLF